MNLSQLFYILRWLVHDTFRQSLASSAFWLLLILSGLCIAFCLSVSIQQTAPLVNPDDIAINPDRGEIALGFGSFRLQLFRDKAQAVHFLQVILGEWIAGTVGLLLSLIWTAGFLPAFLEPTSATVLLAKPLPRWVLLLGKSVGVLVFVAFQGAIFIGGTWLALGIRTGVWNPQYLVSFPIFLLQFAVIYSASVLLGVWTRSTAACVFGSIGFWLLCYGVNFARYAGQLVGESATPALQILVDLGYWILPKPADMVILLHNALDAGKHFSLPEGLQNASFAPIPSVVSSLVFAVVIFVVAAYEFSTMDY